MAAAANQSSSHFDKAFLFESPALQKAKSHLDENDLKSAIVEFFGLPEDDTYVYHAMASVTLSQVQIAVNAGRLHHLHDWYIEGESKIARYPPVPDIQAYISLFDPRKSVVNSLISYAANAKKGSIRATVAQYLQSKRYLHPSVTVPRRKAAFTNPYFLFWAWSCHSLEYAGPNKSTEGVKISHHVLPIFMHHFGCVCPSYEALEILSRIAAKRRILDIGSGNGYWTLMLRRHGCNVVAIDNLMSSYRTSWITDAIEADGVKFVHECDGAEDDVLLLVYPVVGGDFTHRVINSYRGDVICIAGTQNGNGYTGFKDMIIDEWMKDNRAQFAKVCQVPLPSFAGKDDALFIFMKER